MPKLSLNLGRVLSKFIFAIYLGVAMLASFLAAILNSSFISVHGWLHKN
jgi:hypothetical protein